MGKLDIRGYQDCPPYSSRVFLCSKLIWVAFLGHRICFPDGLSLTKSFYSVEKGNHGTLRLMVNKVNKISWYCFEATQFVSR